MAERNPRDPRHRRATDQPDEAPAAAEPATGAPMPRTSRQRAWWSLRKGGRGLLAVVTVALGLVAIAATALWVLTNTDWGRERVRRYAISQFEKNTNGRLRIGRVSGNLLEGFTFHALAITEKNGAPFLATDSLRARYSLKGALRQQLAFDDVVLWRPVVVLDNPPTGRWNWQRIFRREKPDVPKDDTPGFGDWVSATDVRIVDGDVLVKTTWKVDTLQSKAEQQKDIREALSGEERDLIVRHPDGFQKVMRFRQIDAVLPHAIIADPSIEWRRFDIASARLVAQPFRPPYADVRDLQGTIRLDGDSVWWKGLRVRTPGSQLVGDGRYWIKADDAWIRARGEQVALADFRWAYPRLPSQGGGPANVEYRYAKDFMTFRAREMDVRIGGQRARGALGFTFVDAQGGDTLVMHDTRLRLAGFEVKTLEQLLDIESPRQGTVAGQVSLAGGTHAMRLDGDVTFRERVSGTNRFVGGGWIGFIEKPGGSSDVVLRDGRFRLAPFQVALVQQDFPDIPLGGSVTGNVVVNGSVDLGGTVTGSFVHVDRGERSAFTGRITSFYERDPIRFDVDGVVRPFSLAVAGRFAPTLGLQGYASGPVRLRGTFERFSLDTDVQLANGGAAAARGIIDVSGAVPRYDLAMRARALDLAAVLARMPHTSLTGTAQATGRGVTPETMAGTYVANLHGSRWDTLAVDSAIARVRVADGLLGIDRFRIGGRGIEAVAEGSFGMRRDRSGLLTYRVAVADLSALAPLVPALSGDTGLVQPRPGVLASRLRAARADS
ncbi:MAG TPA: hypothetical protein VEA99_18840, partial [Gemmatimonadaceae bacterium]|nr:hypothetical protein [Gemmatimonadaceae bacterium]